MGSKQTTTSRADPWAPTQAGLKSVIGDAMAMYKNGGMTMTPYQGDWVAPQSENTQQANAGLAAMVPEMTGYAKTAADTISNLASTQNLDQLKANTIADIMPAINGSFAGSGMTGSSLHAQNLAKGLAAGLGNVELQGRDQQARYASMLPGLGMAMADPTKMLAQVGAGQDAYSQSVTDANIKKDYMTQAAPMEGLQQLAQLLSGIGGQFGTSTNTQKQSMGLGGILGLGLQGASMFSDVRLKEDIRRIGTADNGLPLYAYRYLGDPETHIGVMAQEAQAFNPGAVGEFAGFLTVDYGELF